MSEKTGDDKRAGVLTGLCVGSALGAPLENAKPGAVKSTFGDVTEYVDVEKMVVHKLHRWRTPGLYGLDAQLALALLDTAFTGRTFDPERAGALIVALSRGDAALPFGALRGAGRDIQDAVLALKQLKPWAEAGRPYAGVAPAARIAPLAVWYGDKPHALPEIIIQASLLTHRNPMSVSAAAAVAHLALEFLDRGSLTARECPALMESAAAFARDVEDRLAAHYPDSLHGTDAGRTLHVLSATLEQLAGRLEQDDEPVRQWLVSNAREYYPHELARAAIDFAPSCAPYALYVFMRHAAEPGKALAASVARGGAAGALGAITGALCGALHGESGLPEQLLGGLANRRQIRARALALAARKVSGAQLQNTYDMEESLTRKEIQEREARMRKNKRFSAAQEKKALKKGLAPKESNEKSPSKQKLDRKKLKNLKEKQRDWTRYLPPQD
jgi:ADP-ribosylglycohydrolase